MTREKWQQYGEKPVRKSTELRPSQWAALDRLAEALGCVAERGPNAGEPSWRALLYRLAEAGARPTSGGDVSLLDKVVCNHFGLPAMRLWDTEMIKEVKLEAKLRKS